MLNILYLYNATQTYTNAVYEHIASLSRYTRHRPFFCHQDSWMDFNLDLSRFDAIGIHYSIRMPFDQLAPSTVAALKAFNGLKFLFVQDEYDHTHRTWHWIQELDLQLVFTVVPSAGVERIYPATNFPRTRFVTVLTGYVPEDIADSSRLPPPSRRPLVVGYRGRPLSVRYGQLGMEKVSIGRIVRDYCEAKGIACDIAWTESARIYGASWYGFVTSCRSMLGSESGSNVFDWDGSLVKRIDAYLTKKPRAKAEDIYRKFVRAAEIEGIMNQVSPRIFESIAARTVLVLYEGEYSGVVRPGEHFIPVRKDGSNLDEVFRLLQDDAYVDAMAERAYADVIGSGRYSYRSFAELIEARIEEGLQSIGAVPAPAAPVASGMKFATSCTAITSLPIRAEPPPPAIDPPAPEVPLRERIDEGVEQLRVRSGELKATTIELLRHRKAALVASAKLLRYRVREIGAFLWLRLPKPLQERLKFRVKRLLGME